MDTWTLILAIILGVYTFYYYVLRDLTFFEKAGIPHRRPMPILGNAWRMVFRRISLAELIEETYNIDEDAKYVGLFDFTSPTVMIRDPDLIKSIAVKNFDHFTDHRSFGIETVEPLFGKNLFVLRGEVWREMRYMLSPAFTASKMRAMFKLMNECALNFADYWTKVPAERRNCIDTKDAFTRYTNDVIATCAFGINVNSLEDPDNLFYVYGKSSSTFTGFKLVKFFLFRSVPSVCKILGMRLFKEEVHQFFKSIVESTIRMRDEKGITRPDMLQLMMESRGKRGEKDLTIDEMISQVFIFFLAGFDNTSLLMCFAAHEIAVNPDVQKRLQKDIDEVLDKNEGELTYEALQDMKYLDAVINETLRLYPAPPMIERECVKDFELPPPLPAGKPHLVKKGSYVWFPTYGLHMDPQYFPEPRKFNPDRFYGDDQENVNLSCFMPFGLGPRMCIGNRFVLLETKVILFHLLARHDLIPCEKTPIPIKFTKSTFVTSPEGGFWLKIQPRSIAR